MSLVLKVRSVLEKLYTKHLLATNIVTCGSLLGLGDCFVQRINMMINKEEKYDFPRTGRMILIGFSLGPFNHFWYSLLDKFIKGRTGANVLTKIACDQMVAAPFFCSSFLCGLSFLEGHGLEGAKLEMREKFFRIYLVDWAFWPAAQFVNFRFVPSSFRVLYVSFAALLWNIFLSYIKHDHVSADEVDVH
ncbi:unnamed protein product [Candidula unifasciata]|uniref:Mpv17-like protein 2 n=1 Tax=Candidula unifasciata TaxID=100452 RepID=A0A8S3ZTZ4_9EUPU|nr:unnamed protein product [Candidula unifasciata]